MNRQIRLLLIEDNDSIALLIRRILAARGFEVSWADSLAAGLKQLQISTFDIVVTDLSLPDSDGLETFRRIHADAADTPVVVLTSDEQESTAVAAVSEGAEDFLTKTQYQPESLARTLRLAFERHRNRAVRASAKRGTILAFLGVKGGVGASTAALNVAAALVSANQTCIAVELRSDRGSFSVQLAHKPARNLSSLREMSPESVNRAALDAILVDAYPNLRILHGPQEPSEFGDIPVEVGAAVLDAAMLAADYVVLDLPARAAPLTQLGASRARFVTLVLDRDPTAVNMARGALPLLRLWGIEHARTGGLTVNRSASNEGIPPQELQAALGCQLLGVVPLDHSRTPGFDRNLPITIRKPEAFAASTLIDIAGALRKACKLPA